MKGFNLVGPTQTYNSGSSGRIYVRVYSSGTFDSTDSHYCDYSTSANTTVVATWAITPYRAPYIDPKWSDIVQQAVWAERARLTRLGIEQCCRQHDLFKGKPTDHRVLRWQWRGARGFRNTKYSKKEQEIINVNHPAC